jgi:type I restriction enzyme M protein
MFQQTFKNLDDIMFQEPGCNTELDYVEQSSWMLFLKYLDDLETERSIEAQLTGKPFEPLFNDEFRWSAWAAPKTADGKPDLDNTRIGMDLIEFVNNNLMPYLRGFKQTAPGPDTIQYKIGEIFGEVRNKFQNGYMLREALALIDQLKFGTQEQKHELSDLYETRIKSMGNAGRNGGQYYTPRPLIRAMIKVTDPKLGETIYDGAAGSAGFLCEAYEYLRPKVSSPTDYQTLQRDTFYGKEQAPLAYVIGLMNMILHGISAPNYLRTDTLADHSCARW